MKKIMLTAAAVMAFAFSNAQETKFGVKGGLNLTNLTGDVEGTSSLIGFHVGGFAEIKLTDKFAIQPELLFSTQGAKIEETFFDESYEYDTKLNYLNIPVLAKFYVTEAFSVEAGPQLGVLLSAKQDGEDVKDFYKSVDFGFNVGAGYNFTENLSVGLRYTIGLSSVFDTPDSDELEGFEIEDIDVKNSVFALSLGYKF
ncbi:porin family protein [Flavobacterium sp. HTF]|uniref:porin family protein n=1 Tax=Flavobacterium sp. HTF TaxID=2170732 RepID=UPI000D5F8D26|nr:porin family protein [Flavobacterium sp. HTF]PWB25631.1 PorT family protein [Flavobacterium sp. HTF]